MIVHCPNCETSFAVADEMYRPGRKARCSQCRHVFAMPALLEEDAFAGGKSVRAEEFGQELPPPVASEKPTRKKMAVKIAILGTLMVLFLGGAGFGGFTLYTAYQDKKAAEIVKNRREAREKEAVARKEQDAAVSAITLVNVRQTVVENRRIGPLVVIEGYARNDYETPREFIEVEARLLDKAGKVLGNAKQSCGVSLTLTQLQVLSLEELGKALNNPVDILSKNVNVMTGGQVPFIVVFSGVPEDLYSYEVRPIRAEVPPPL